MSKNVPKLRFSEFSNGWENKKLGDLVELLGSGKTRSRDDDGKYRLYGSTGIIGATNERDYVGDSILIARVGANAGAVNYASGEYGVSDNTLVIKFLNEVHPRFSYYQLIKQNINKMVFGSGQPLITGGQLKILEVSFPQLSEQIKIASFLSTLDARIGNQSSKLDSLQELKKGIMQKIFSQEIRFKREDGGEYPEWEEMSIASLGTFYNGLSGKSKKDFSDGNKKYITYMNVFKNSIANPDDVSFVKINENEKQNIVGYGDVIFTQSSETVEEVGMSSVWMGDEEVYLNSFCFGFRPSSHSVTLPEYLAQVLRSGVVRSRIMMEGHGTTRINLSSARLGNVEIPIPKSIEEQQKIADFLSTLDSKISLESQILETLQTLKKGLLQQMFV